MASKPTYNHFFLSSDYSSFKEVSIGLKPYICFDLDECKEKTHDCEDKCINEVGSYSCGCSYGYELHTDKKSCTKIDACLKANCDHSCHPINGTLVGYLCSCNDGYVLQPDKKTCKPHVPSSPRNLITEPIGQTSLRINWTMTNLYDIDQI